MTTSAVRVPVPPTATADMPLSLFQEWYSHHVDQPHAGCCATCVAATTELTFMEREWSPQAVAVSMDEMFQQYELDGGYRPEPLGSIELSLDALPAFTAASLADTPGPEPTPIDVRTRQTLGIRMVEFFTSYWARRLNCVKARGHRTAPPKKRGNAAKKLSKRITREAGADRCVLRSSVEDQLDEVMIPFTTREPRFV